MKRQFLPYYVSRAVLSVLLSLLALGLTWKAALLAPSFFALFVWYLHSGWFEVDAGQPFFPLRRDERGREIQRRALIAGLVTGVVVFLGLAALPISVPFQLAAGPLGMVLGAAAYFGVQFFLFARS